MSDQSESARSRRGSEKVHSSFNERVYVGENRARGVAVQCQFCPGQGFRRSSLRTTDIQDLFLMRYPVRCLRCGQRQKVSFAVASVAIPSHVKQRRHRRSAEKFADLLPTVDEGRTAEASEEQDPSDAPKGEL
jgi:hypothetical protein